MTPNYLYGLVSFAYLVSIVTGEGQFVWVPRSTCSAPLKFCFEGELAELKRGIENGMYSPCRDDAEIVEGSCQELGYDRLIGEDPINKDVRLFVDGNFYTAEKLAPKLEAVEGACWKNARPRVPRVAKECTGDEDREAGLCFPKCAADEETFGPICVGGCQDPYPVSAGIVCCESSEICTRILQKEGFKIIFDITKILIDQNQPEKLFGDIQRLLEDLQNFQLPKCPAGLQY